MAVILRTMAIFRREFLGNILQPPQNDATKTAVYLIRGNIFLPF